MARGVALCFLIIFATWLTHYEIGQAAERPVHSAILCLLCAGLSLQLSRKLLPGKTSGRTRRRGQSYSAIPLQDIGFPHNSSDEPLPIARDLPPPALGLRQRRLYFVLVVACIAARVEIFRRIVHNLSCTHNGVEVLLPTFLAVYDFITVQRHRPPPPEYDAISNSIFDDMSDACVNSSLRYLFPTAILSWAAHITSNSALRSTYICPITQNEWFPVSWLQYAGVCLDVVIISAGTRLLSDSDDKRRSRRVQSSIGLLTAAFILTLGIVAYTLVDFQARKSWTTDLSGAYLSSAFSLAILFSVIIHLLLYLAPAIRPLSISVILVFACVYFSEVFHAYESRTAFPAQSKGIQVCALILAFLGIVLFVSLEEVSDSAKTLARVSRQMPTLFISVATAILFLTGILYIARSNGIGFHPIDFLVYNARIGSESWLKQASSSSTLKGAVREYKSRYGKVPPPNFDKWYAFAVNHQSMIIDDYDQVMEDLSPFWALQPAEIRAKTTRVLMNPWNEIAGISIRNGKATPGPHGTPATHQWMVDGVALMINSFSEWLPDMDLAFNLFDEPRVAVPYFDLEEYRKIVQNANVENQRAVNPSFSEDAAGFWNSEWMNEETELPDLGPAESPFQLGSFHQSFSIGTRGCPPKSAAFRIQMNPREHCVSCAAPHSIGEFISNWTLAGNLCHQPDMANLHGFHLAPAALKVSTSLLPVFSQSKVPGYNDILYPSAWNYLDKVKYDEDQDLAFHEKRNTLFWRGLTTEGVSNNREWRGMARQRFVHLANNITATTMVPMVINDNKLYYQNIPARDLEELLHFNASFVDHAIRCGDNDCQEQNIEFNITEGTRVDFQEHWNYRYVMDMDGAGFSGRFLPFLWSRSLPFRASIFREWFDSRLTAWLHFVPIDTRLHGLYATLSYFAGLGDGQVGFERVGGRLVQMEGRHDQAEWIATQGWKWAEKALRKEDMEIYFFRLLLEWGRLVDERRDEIGFWLDE